MEKKQYISNTEKLFNLEQYKPEIASRTKNDINAIFNNSLNPEIIYDNLQEVKKKMFILEPCNNVISEYKKMVSESLSTKKPSEYFKIFSNFFLKHHPYYKNGQELLANSEKIEKIREFDYSNEKNKKIDRLVEQIWNNNPGSAENLVNLADPKHTKNNIGYLKSISASGISLEDTLKDKEIFNLLIYDNTGLRIVGGYAPNIKREKTYPVKTKSEYNIADVQNAFIIQNHIKTRVPEGGHYDHFNKEIILIDSHNNIPSIAHEVQHAIDDLCNVKTDYFKQDWEKEYTAEIADMLAEITYGGLKEDKKRNFTLFLQKYYNYLADHFDKQDLREKLRNIDFNDIDKKNKLMEEHFNSISSHRKLPLNQIHRDAIYEIFCGVAGKKLEKEDCGVYMNYRYDNFKKPNLIKSLKNLRDGFYRGKIGLGYEEIKNTCKKLVKKN